MTPNPEPSTTQDGPRAASRHRIALALIVVLAFALRIYRLGVDPYWSDEVDNLNQAEHIGAVLLQGEFVSNHPPLFATLLAGWRALGLVDNEWTGKSLPMLIGVISVPLIYLLGVRMHSRRAGLFAAFLLAVSPFHILHSQDLKDYILLPATAMVAALCLLRAMERNSFRAWAQYAIAVTVVCYSESFAALFLIALGVWFLCRWPFQRDRLPGFTIANAVGVGLFVPWLYFLVIAFRRTLIEGETWWIPRPTVHTTLVYLKTIAFGYSDLKPHLYIAMALFFAAAAGGLVVMFRRNRAHALLLILWAALPPALAFAMSHVTQSLFLFRALLPFAIPCYVLAAIGLAAIPHARLRRLGLVVATLIAAFPLSQYYRDIYPVHEFPHRPGISVPADYDLGAAFVLDRWQEGDIVVHSSAAAWMPFFWYGLRGYPQYHAAVDAERIDYFTKGHPDNTSWELTQNWHPQRIESVVGDARRIWFVFSEWHRESLRYGAYDAYRWMDAHYTETLKRDFRGFDIRLFEAEDGLGDLQTLQRDLDDGASAVMTQVVRNEERVYWKERPDLGAVRTPPSERQGRLVLRFDGAEPVRIDDQGRRLVGFAVDNVSRNTVVCDVMVAISDRLVPLASLYEEDLEADRWWISTQYNPSPPPEAFGTSVVVTRLEPGEGAWLRGEAILYSGLQQVRLYMLGTPGDTAHYRAALHIEIGATTWRLDGPSPPNEAFGWQWRPIGALEVDPSRRRVPLRIGAIAPDDAEGPRYADLGYLAFTADPPPDDAPSPGRVTLTDRETLRWTAPLDRPGRRVDIWVREQVEEGRTYHIFTHDRPER